MLSIGRTAPTPAPPASLVGEATALSFTPTRKTRNLRLAIAPSACSAGFHPPGVRRGSRLPRLRPSPCFEAATQSYHQAEKIPSSILPSAHDATSDPVSFFKFLMAAAEQRGAGGLGGAFEGGPRRGAGEVSGSAAARPSQQRPVLGMYYYTIPVRPVCGDISIDHLERISWYNGLYGAVYVALGVAALTFPYITTLNPGSIFGWLLLVAGALSILNMLFLYGAPGTSPFLMLGALNMASAFYLFTPGLHDQAVGIMFFFTLWFLTQGIVKVILSVSVSSISSWPLVLISGLTSVALGTVIFSLNPEHALSLLGLLVGADFILTGISIALLSLLASWGIEMVASAEEPLLGLAQGAVP